jgi:ribosomal protein S18 acetylase RimI-like enzyme
VDDNWQRERFEEQFDPALLQIIEYDSQPIGYISVRRPGTEIFLATIEIASAFQDRGVGTQLISNLLNDADQPRLPVKLSVLKVNPARRLHERLGISMHRRNGDSYRDAAGATTSRALIASYGNSGQVA